ncbi:uncharacterized protein LOC125869662 [Solanum stenotomum]|uniref:uncharacterized protein LOC125869662 n=1 Tax=Solanum stenotomum TaxID=172797 RepID=UPI0020D00BC1|nr:uncharacterized protein LOC125869662 [Solanum stenotomum]
MQKGLTSTVKHLLPEVEHRMCARHILANWAKDYRGLKRRNQFWKCARSTFEAELKANLAHMALLGNKDIVPDLLHYDVKTWCKMYFRTDVKCDSIDNNMAKNINAWILAPRHKTIITMLEEIRVKVMNRLGQFHKFPETWLTNISPMALKVLEKNIAKLTKCHTEFNGERGFEISNGCYVHTVDMRSRICSCKSWMLKGIPCPHAIASILYKNWEPIDCIDDYYSKETYLRTYCHYLQPVTNMKMWPDSTNHHVEPQLLKLCQEGQESIGKNHNIRSCPLKDFVAAGPSNETGTSRAISKPRGRPRKTHITTTEAPATDGEPHRPKGRHVNPDAPPPSPRGRPRKTTNNEAPATSTIGKGYDS